MKKFFLLLLLLSISSSSFAGATGITVPVDARLEALEIPNIEARKNKKIKKVSVFKQILLRKIQKRIVGSQKPKRDERETTKKGIFSLVAGIASWVLPAILNIGLLFLGLTVTALVLGIMGIKESGSDAVFKGEGLAITGLVIGSLNILVLLIAVVIVASLIASGA